VPLRSWLGEVLDPRVHPALYVVALAVPLVVTNVQQVVRALGGGQLSVSLPGPPHLIVAFVLAQVVLFGGTEEVGWRGYLQPRLQQRTSVLTAGVAIGVVWWAWHLPLFVGRANYVAEPLPLVTYTTFVLGASTVLGAFVNVTGGRALPVMLLHGTVNLGPLLAGSGGVFDGPHPVALVVGSGLWWVLAGALVGRYGREMVPGDPVEPLD
jgi:membrane protease YdiL (CAAX protease family)